MKNATVISPFYLYRPEEKAWEAMPRTASGSVSVHEGFTSQRDTRGFVDPDKRVADLAVVVLEDDLGGLKPDVYLSERRVSAGDELFVVGYGPSKDQGPDRGVRRSGTNKVSPPEGWAEEKGLEFRFKNSGAHTLDGDSGGPALYLDKGGKRWLVGINAGFVKDGGQSWFTSTESYYKWITGQIERAEKLGSP